MTRDKPSDYDNCYATELILVRAARDQFGPLCVGDQRQVESCPFGKRA